ncbi:MAG: phosphotransferase [Clostridiales bacterium]|nr:phosphotransferase [Clostridiales bacterium]
MQSEISTFLARHYALDVHSCRRMTTGVGGDTFRVDTATGSYVFKIIKADAINHPEQEAELCRFLRQKGVPASEFLPNHQGALCCPWDDTRLCHLQRFVDGQSFPMNTAPDWLMAESPLLLARIHQALTAYPALPEGIGAGFFSHATPEFALDSYKRSLSLARERGEEDVAQALLLRMKAAEKIRGWHIDPNRLTCRSTHGDYTVNQILCKDGQVRAIIDWTSACVHPVVWELVRSYVYVAPECAQGGFSQARLSDQVAAYTSVAPLNTYDREHLMDVYLYQLAVCDYYSQYLHAAPHERLEFRQQADFATRVLKCALL